MKRGRELESETQKQWPKVLLALVNKYGIMSQYFYHLPTIFNWYAACGTHRHTLLGYAAKPGMLRYVFTQKKEHLSQQGSGKLHMEWRQQFAQLENAINITTLCDSLLDVRNLSRTHSYVEPRTYVQFKNSGVLATLLGTADLTGAYVPWLFTQCRALIAVRTGLDLVLRDTNSDNIIYFPWVSFAGLVLSISFCDSGLLTSWLDSQLHRTKALAQCVDTPALTFDCLLALSEYGIESPNCADVTDYLSWFATCRRLRDWFMVRQDRQFGLLRAKYVREARYNGKLEVKILRRQARLIDGMRIEKLMTHLVAQLVGVFTSLSKTTGQCVVNPASMGEVLCDLSDLTKVAYQAVAATNMAGGYPLWLLAQCRTRIATRYGWCLVLFDTVTNVTLPFPWAWRTSHVNIQLVVCNGAYRPGC